MRISLSVDTYKGVDGSSLSPIRCSQMVKVYEMLENMGTTKTSYVGIQDEAAQRNLFGKTKARSAIRTLFPLLKKIHFVDYEGTFPANKCFTNLGTTFVLACRTLDNVTDSTPHKDEIIERLNSIKSNAQREGLVNMYNNHEWKNHNMWIVLKLFKALRVIHWNEFLYTLYVIEQGKTIDDAINEILNNKEKIDNIEFVNEENEPLPITCYTYLRGYLEEARLISKVSTLESKILPELDLFYSQIGL